MTASLQPRSSAETARADQHHQGNQPRAASLRRFLLALVTIFALSWQSTLVATHIHPLLTSLPSVHALASPTADLSLAAAAGSYADETHPGSSDRGPDNCPICHERRIAGLYLWPTLIAFIVPALPVFWARPAALQTMHRDARSHNWQSRAPPHRP